MVDFEEDFESLGISENTDDLLDLDDADIIDLDELEGDDFDEDGDDFDE